MQFLLIKCFQQTLERLGCSCEIISASATHFSLTLSILEGDLLRNE